MNITHRSTRRPQRLSTCTKCGGGYVAGTGSQHVCPLTNLHLDEFAHRDEWLGFGYIGERERALQNVEPEAPSVAVADEMVLFHANRLGWTVDQFFAWANSRSGRYAGDVLFGSPLSAQTDIELRALMTLKGLDV